MSEPVVLIDVLKVVVPCVLTFFVGIFITPFFTNIFYKYKLWKRNLRTNNPDITNDHFTKLHNGTAELSTPRVGGVIIWVSVLLTVLIIFFVSHAFPTTLSEKLNFLSRNQTIVPLITLLLASLVGLVDDLLQIFGKGVFAKDPLFYRKIKIASIALIGLVISFWFSYPL